MIVLLYDYCTTVLYDTEGCVLYRVPGTVCTGIILYSTELEPKIQNSGEEKGSCREFKSFFEEKIVEKCLFFVFIDSYRTRPRDGETCSLHVTPTT
jgi:hypothetical protein